MDHVLFPRFWKEEPALWFAQVEAVFKLNNISSEKDKYDYILCELPSSVICLVKDIILDSTTEFENGKYDRIKKELIKRISIAELEKDEMGSMKPSEFYKYLKRKADPRISENVLKEIWLKKLPQQVNYVICHMNESDIESACKIADTVIDYIPNIGQTKDTELTNIITDETNVTGNLKKNFDSVSAQLHKFKLIYNENTSHMEKIQAELYKFQITHSENYSRLNNVYAELQCIKSAMFNQNYNNEKICDICKCKSEQGSKELNNTGDNDQSNSTSKSNELDESENIEMLTEEKVEKNEIDAKTDTLCWYHKFYGANAHNCLPPCNFKTKATAGSSNSSIVNE